MSRKLLEIAVHGENVFVLLLNGVGGSQIRLNPSDYISVGVPRVVTDVPEALRQAPERSNAYTLSAPHVRTDLHGSTLQALQFYHVREDLVT